MRWMLSTVAAAAMLCSASSAGACVDFVSPPQTFERANWSELEGFVADKSLNDEITDVEEIGPWGQGDLNIDQYSITLDADGQSAAGLLAELRQKFSDVLFAGSNYQNFRPYSATDAALWSSDDPTGAVMVFTLAQIPVVELSLEDAAVVVSCYAADNFLFSTVQVGSMISPSDPGLHPVAGNRGFGVRDDGNDALTFYVKAADRIVNKGMFSLAGDDARELIFTWGNNVWLHLLDNIKSEYAGRHPRDIGTFSQRVPY